MNPSLRLFLSRIRLGEDGRNVTQNLIIRSLPACTTCEVTSPALRYGLIRGTSAICCSCGKSLSDAEELVVPASLAETLSSLVERGCMRLTCFNQFSEHPERFKGNGSFLATLNQLSLIGRATDARLSGTLEWFEFSNIWPHMEESLPLAVRKKLEFTPKSIRTAAEILLADGFELTVLDTGRSGTRRYKAGSMLFQKTDYMQYMMRSKLVWDCGSRR